ADVKADRIEIQAEAERVERFGREHRLVREPVGSPSVQKDRGAVVVCRYVIVGPDGAVVRAGATGATGATSSGLFVIGREGGAPATPAPSARTCRRGRSASPAASST